MNYKLPVGYCVLLLLLCWVMPVYGQETAADGSKYVVVEAGESLWEIAARHGLTLDELLKLNDKTRANTIIYIGDKITVAPAPPPTVTPLPTATPLPTETAVPTDTPPPSPTPLNAPTLTPTALPPAPQTGILCTLVYDDVNGNGAQDGSERAIDGETMRLVGADERRLGSDGSCYTLPVGEYTLVYDVDTSRYQTVRGNRAVRVMPDVRETVAFDRLVVEESADLSWLIPIVGAFALVVLFIAYRNGDITRSRRW